MMSPHTLSIAMSVMCLLCAACNGFWLYKALKYPASYPRWFKYMAGAGTLYCVIAAVV